MKLECARVMKINKNKKGLEGPLWILIIAIALIIFLIVYLGVFNKLFGKEAKTIGEQIKNTQDHDADGTPNFNDKCPCKWGSLANDGCDSPNPSEDDKKRDCLK